MASDEVVAYWAALVALVDDGEAWLAALEADGA